MKKYKLLINRGKCIGCGTCINLLPEIFEMDDANGLVRANNSTFNGNYFVLEINEDQLDYFQKIADSCPSQVFRIEK